MKETEKLDVVEKLEECGDRGLRERVVNRVDTKNGDVAIEWAEMMNQVSMTFGDRVIEWVKRKF